MEIIDFYSTVYDGCIYIIRQFSMDRNLSTSGFISNELIVFIYVNTVMPA